VLRHTEVRELLGDSSLEAVVVVDNETGQRTRGVCSGRCAQRLDQAGGLGVGEGAMAIRLVHEHLACSGR
jgi:hypothetical protein